MNKVRKVGLLILVIGIIILFFISKDVAIDFLSALLIGLGIGLLITGKIRNPIS
uniref:hypothetical protein n=1 Tax=Gelidibacter sp. TaxID=2018083 RepID=UPI00404B59B1